MNDPHTLKQYGAKLLIWQATGDNSTRFGNVTLASVFTFISLVVFYFLLSFISQFIQ